MKDLNTGGIPPAYLHVNFSSAQQTYSPTLIDLFARPRGGSRKQSKQLPIPCHAPLFEWAEIDTYEPSAASPTEQVNPKVRDAYEIAS